MGSSICWTAAETDTQFTIFDSSALKKQFLIFSNPNLADRGMVPQGLIRPATTPWKDRIYQTALPEN
jgi:hypothetical protein